MKHALRSTTVTSYSVPVTWCWCFGHQQTRHISRNSAINQGLRSSRGGRDGDRDRGGQRPFERRSRDGGDFSERGPRGVRPRVSKEQSYDVSRRTAPGYRNHHLDLRESSDKGPEVIRRYADRQRRDEPEGRREPIRRTSKSSSDRQDRPSFDRRRQDEDDEGRDDESATDDKASLRDPRIPFSVPYTTAASVFISGTRSVTAALNAGRRQHYKLHYAEPSFKPSPERNRVRVRASSLNILCQASSMSYLDQLASKLGKKGDDLIHDGLILETSPLPQRPVMALGPVDTSASNFAVRFAPLSQEMVKIFANKHVLPYASEAWRKPFLLWLHGVVDTRNLGAIARTALYFGVDALILTTRATASADNPAALRTSAGALEYLPVLRLPSKTDPLDFISASQYQGWHFVSAVAPLAPGDGARKVQRHAFLHDLPTNPVATKPTVLVLGNEDQGLPLALAKKTDQRVSIRGPKKGAVEAGLDSLNVGIAGAVLIDWFLTQKKGAGKVVEETSEEDGESEKDEVKGDDLF